MSEEVDFTVHGDIAILKAFNPPVNALSQRIRADLVHCIERAEHYGVAAILICCRGSTFFAGADIREFGQVAQSPFLPDVCERIESSQLIVVSAMHGTILGGGLELALSCDYRLASLNAYFGFPEVNIGLIPGAGGTQRLPRLVGVEKAVSLISKGHRISAMTALEIGLIDATKDGDQHQVGITYVRDLIDQGAKRRCISKLQLPTTDFDFDLALDRVRRTSHGQLSPNQAIKAVQSAINLPFDQGMNYERQLFNELKNSNQHNALKHVFFGERSVGKLPELTNIKPREITNVGVVGGGTMGAGIAVASLLSGYSVTLIETSTELSASAETRVVELLEGALTRGKITKADLQELRQNRLTFAVDLSALSNADLIIEAVFEDLQIKKDVFIKLDKVCKNGAVLASNTSYLDINEIASLTTRPQDIMGLHFFSPAHIMRLLEVIVGDKTASDVLATAFAFGKALKKVAVLSQVCDGFIGNRILSVYRAAANHMVLHGATPFQIDAALVSFGFKMGPYAVADLAGLDIAWAERKRKQDGDFGRRFAESNVADRLCEKGDFGQKTGKGYYVYQDGFNPAPNLEILTVIEEERAAKRIIAREFSNEDIICQYMAAMVNESAKVVGEGIARRPLDVDMILIFGYGFPRHCGGPLKWADQQGLSALLSDIRNYGKMDADFWRPAPLLEQLVTDGRVFDDLN
ncbi:MAG: 3-hydroxyacyl-CoA dehydrogenase NAD-binding domain-containing protein [Aestuariivita sp.]|nr:3-hydroxyacyl-CoA dehydrogenase NAD-binding domain-containing protein [Aestuariivita sp.]